MKLTLHHGRPTTTADRLQKEIRTYNLLDELNIPFDRIDHEPAETMEACEAIDEALAPAVICKNLFLCTNKKDQYYLLALRGDKKFVTKDISKQVGSTRLSFASAEDMEKYLDITPGSVSVMGLMNDHDCKVKLIVDEDVLKEELFACHPCINTSSIRMKTEDVFGKFLERINHEYEVVIVNAEI